jgi:transposase-like protein
MRVQNHREYDRTFKEDALALLRRTDRTINTVARDLGVPPSTLDYWYKAACWLEMPSGADGERHDRLSPVRSRPRHRRSRISSELVAENVLLRQQLIVAERKVDPPALLRRGATPVRTRYRHLRPPRSGDGSSRSGLRTIDRRPVHDGFEAAYEHAVVRRRVRAEPEADLLAVVVIVEELVDADRSVNALLVVSPTT